MYECGVYLQRYLQIQLKCEVKTDTHFSGHWDVLHVLFSGSNGNIKKIRPPPTPPTGIDCSSLIG